MKPQQKAASEKAARILELSKGATAGPWHVVESNHRLRIHGDFHGRPAGISLHHLEIWESKTGARRGCAPNWLGFTETEKADAAIIAETRTLAPDVATALIDAHAEIERLKSAAKEYIDAVEAWGRIGVNRPKHVHNAAAKRRTAALAALKKLST